MSPFLEDGSIYSCGSNNSGQLGIGNNQNQPIPQIVKNVSQVISVCGGGYHSIALTSIKYIKCHFF